MTEGEDSLGLIKKQHTLWVNLEYSITPTDRVCGTRMIKGEMNLLSIAQFFNGNLK